MEFKTISKFTTGDNQLAKFYSIPSLADQGFPNINRLPVSIRIILESLLRHQDDKKVSSQDIQNLAAYQAKSPGEFEVPFTVARIVLQDFTGVPLLVDLAAMRSAVNRLGKKANMIEPLVPVDLVVDHSVQVDFSGSQNALDQNLAIEFQRNRERYEFLKWGQQAFQTFSVVPPGIGIVHQVNLEYLAQGILQKDNIYYPDTLVGTDSHTTMINGLGIIGWGVGGIEAEAGMLGQPVIFKVPEVIGVHLEGKLSKGVTATDLALHITQLLRQEGVVGKFVEFFGSGAVSLPLPDRSTIANMAPEYGSTIGFFPIDEISAQYLLNTGRSPEKVQTFKNYFQAQQLWGIPQKGEVDYTQEINLDLSSVIPSVAGPKRPQDRIQLNDLKNKFDQLLKESIEQNGFGKDQTNYQSHSCKVTNKNNAEDQLSDGSVVIAAITSCTNTSNPSVMIAAGLLAQKANQLGLTVSAKVKTSLAPGSRVVTDYLQKTGLQKELDQLGFQTVGYGCTTCIGNSGPLDIGIESVIDENKLVVASVLSGNRNFEARIHQAIKANFLMSPPLVVAFAIAGNIHIDLSQDSLGKDKQGNNVYLRDIWPNSEEIQACIKASMSPQVFKDFYRNLDTANPKWNEIPSSTGEVYPWKKDSTYVQEPPFFDDFSLEPTDIFEIHDARPLGIFGDSVTTDHISPAGAIKTDSPAGRYLQERGIDQLSFNSYGSRRGNDQIMTRGTFSNVRIKNLMLPGSEGGVTLYFDASGNTNQADIYDAAQNYKQEQTNLIVIGGSDYGMGSSRDWAAKGTHLLGVKAVITKSFERIHRSNLVGMGVLPLTFENSADYDKVKTLTDVTFSITGIDNQTKPQGKATLTVSVKGKESFKILLVVRLDTPIEIDYYRAGGILPYVLAQLIKENESHSS